MSQRDKTLILLLEPSASSYYIVGKTINYLKKIDKNKRFIIVGDKKQFKSEFKKSLYEIKYINEKIPEKKIGIYQVKFKTKKQHFQKVFDVALSNLKNGWQYFKVILSKKRSLRENAHTAKYFYNVLILQNVRGNFSTWS